MLIISTQNFPPVIGGIETLMYKLCQSLSAFEDSLVVFADYKRGYDIAAFDRSQSYRINRASGIKPIRRRLKARTIQRLVREHPEGSIRLITDSWKSLEYIDPEPFSRIICLVHGTEIPRRSEKRKSGRIRTSLAKADYIVTNSNYTAGIASPFINDGSKVRIIHPGITVPQRDTQLENDVAEKFASSSPVLITIARLERRKGQHQVIKILPDLLKHFPDLLYVMIGTGSQQGHLQKMVSQLGLDDHVYFTGDLVEGEKNAYLANSTLYVMPGTIVGDDVEGFGIAYIEAGYFSIPSIASRSGGAPEAVIHDETGLVSDIDDRDQLRDNIIRLLQDKALRHTMGTNASQRARELLWDKQVLEFRKLLDGV